MDFVSLFAGICKLIDAIRQQVKVAKENQPRAERLVERLEMLYSAIQGLDKRDQRDRYLPALNQLYLTLQQGNTLVSCYGEENTWFKRLTNSQSYNAKFDQINQLLAQAISDLQLGLNVNELFQRDQDEADRRKDAEILKSQQQRILYLQEQQLSLAFQLHNDMRQNNAGISLQFEDIKFLVARQEASLKEYMQAQLQQMSATTKKASPFDERFLVPLHTLKFYQKIGKGQFATVYLGQLEDSSDKVAIKVIDGALDKDTHDQFVREVQIMSELRNKYIAQFYGASIDANRAAIVMEYLEGGSLRAVLDQKKPSPTQQNQLLLDIAHGLQYLHSKNILHRDLTSNNILLDQAGHAKLIDFGLSKASNSHIQTAKGRSQAIEWLAPEYLRGDIYTKACDIYSFGLIAWEILTYQRPFSKVSAQELSKRKLAGETEVIPDHIHPFYKDFLKKCWSQDPNLRPKLAEVIEGLQKLNVDVRPDSPTPAEEHFQNGMNAEAKQEYAVARQYYEKAAKKQHVKAYTNLGFLQLMGQGGPKNIEQATHNFLYAADKSHVRAMMNLGKIFKDGLNGSKDKKEALKWYQKAAASGDKSGAVKAQQMQEELNQEATNFRQNKK